jgi:hypothetical protein
MFAAVGARPARELVLFTPVPSASFAPAFAHGQRKGRQMSDERLQALGIPRRGFLKRAGTVAFVAPVVVSFGLDGIAEAGGTSLPNQFNPNQCYPNQACPHYTKTVTGVHNGPLVIATGQSVLVSKATIYGPVTVQTGGGLGVEQSNILGAIKATGATSVVMHGSTIHGSVAVTGSTHLVSIGATDACGSGNNSFFGPVTITSNHGGAYFQDNTVYGPLTVTGNSVPVGNTGNTVYGQRNLQSSIC